MNYTAYTNRSFKQSKYYALLPEQESINFDILSSVFHFKVNNFVCEKLIDWGQIPNDPIYKLVFPRVDMLRPHDFHLLKRIHQNGFEEQQRKAFVASVQRQMAPVQKSLPQSFPSNDAGKRIQGMYWNFPNMVNLFPAPMVKTCHAYCSYCFRWIMFNNREVQENSSYLNPVTPVEWLRAHPGVSDVLFTGADPLVLNAATLGKYLAPILKIDSVKVIHISSKSLAWWPFRFTSDKDADNLLRLFEYIRSKGKHLNFCGHFTHPRELQHPEVTKAVRRIQSAGAIVRTQGPLVRDVNDTPEIWSDMWTRQIKLGMVPYYMFMEAGHHPQSCFRVPVAEALRIFQKAQQQTTGLARTVRGPVFMYDLNRVLLDGTTTLNGQKYFVLKTLQSPPGTHSEGDIRLVPYDEDRMDLGNLYELFNEPATV